MLTKELASVDSTSVMLGKRFWIGFGASLVASSGLFAVESPTFLPEQGSSSTILPVVVTVVDPNLTIHYTLNGAEPTKYDPAVASGGIVTVRRPLTLKAKAWTGETSGATTSREYSITGDISVGASHSILLKSSGDLFTWGKQSNGRLGNGQSADAIDSNPFSYTTIRNASIARAGANHSIVLGLNGYVWCFGKNSSHQTGSSAGADVTSAVQVRKSTTAEDWLSGCVAVDAGDSFSAAVTQSQEIYAWGTRSAGRLGDGSTSGDRYYANKIRSSETGNPALGGIVAVDLGVSSGLARTQFGPGNQVWAWGGNTNGQLGIGTTTNQTYASRVKLNASVYLTDAWDISTAETHSAIVRWKTGDPAMQGTVWSMGSRDSGRLGDNGSTTGNAAYPVKVLKSDGSPLQGIIQVATGSAHTLALDTAGNVWAWGNDGFGALGDGVTISSKNHAVIVKSPDGLGNLSNIVRISAGGSGVTNSSFALSADGTVYAWGNNQSGQLAFAAGSSATPLPVALTNIKSLTGFPDVSLSVSVTKNTPPGIATLTAVPSDPDGPATIQKVEFYCQGALAGIRFGPPWTVNLSNLPTSSFYHVYAVVTDANGNKGVSSPANFYIQSSDDLDYDGLSDVWETQYFGSHTLQNGEGDPDGDHVANSKEFSLGTNPTVATDSDNDGLPDDWELAHFANLLSQNGASHADSDKVNNLLEWTLNTSPVISIDGDNDGLPDDWEILRFTNITSQLGGGDPDSDRLTNLQEWEINTNPIDSGSSDGDLLPDDWETYWFKDSDETDTSNPDGDAYNNLQEFSLGADPTKAPGMFVAAPTFSHSPGNLIVQTSVTVNCPANGAVIHYTLSGSEPTVYDPVVTAGSSVFIGTTSILKARAWLGTDSSSTTSAAYKVTGAISTAGNHVLSISTKGVVTGWGYQKDGRLGNGSIADNSISVPTAAKWTASSPIVNAKRIAAGTGHSLILDSLGSVWGFGNNSLGQLGNNTLTNQTYPVKIMKSTNPEDWLNGCIEVSAGKGFSAALTGDHKIYMWGDQADGRLGNGITTGSKKYAGPVKTSEAGNPDLINIRQIKLGSGCCLAREANAQEQTGGQGFVWGWGANGSGQLGIGNTTTQAYASRVKLNATTYLTDASAIALGTNHVSIVRWKEGDANLQGTVWTIGSRTNGKLGDKGTEPFTGKETYPVQVLKKDGSPLKNIITVSADQECSYAIDIYGFVWSWGNVEYINTSGGPYPSSRVYAAQQVANNGADQLKDIVEISTGDSGYRLALDIYGRVYGWQYESYKVLQELSLDPDVPKMVDFASNVMFPTLLPYRNAPIEIPHISLNSNTISANDPGVVKLTLSVSGSNMYDTLNKVDFYLQGGLLQTVTAPPWTVTLNSLSEGNYHSYAVATDANGNQVTSNSSQFAIKTNIDADGDGLPNFWEFQYGLNSSDDGSMNPFYGGNGDPDGDGLSNLKEFAIGTDPTWNADEDLDSLPDDWELYWFGNLTQGAYDDIDNDGVCNRDEHIVGTNPNSNVDIDNDGLVDDWEINFFGDLQQDDVSDFDADGLSNIKEQRLIMNPLDGSSGDGDNLPDDWELYWFGGLNLSGNDDPDFDHLSNFQEFTFNTDPTLGIDSDSDGLPDDWEFVYFGHWSNIGNEDFDADGLNITQEWNGGSDPFVNEDSDNDGLPDDWEREWFLNLDESSTDDSDDDGVSNNIEFTLQTNPNSKADFDSDGLPDDWERYRFGNLLQLGSWDADSDKISNMKEYFIFTDPTSVLDSDSDGLPDDWETYWFQNLGQGATGDIDNDSLTNEQEFLLGLSPIAADTDQNGKQDQNEDTDGDNIPNFYELNIIHSNPIDPNSNGGDSDNDGLSDGYEIYYFGGIADQNKNTDSDGDGLSNGIEMRLGTNPNVTYESILSPQWDVFLPN